VNISSFRDARKAKKVSASGTKYTQRVCEREREKGEKIEAKFNYKYQ
jgi:hypothetical protein